MDKPYFQFYPADWLSDPNVQFLSLEESGAYITLLAFMWRDGKNCALPDDDKYLARLLHISTRKWIKLREILIDGEHAVLKKSSDGLIRNNRLDEEWEKANKVSKSRSNAAKTRWEAEETETANAMQDECKSNANASDLHMQNDAISESFTESFTEKEKDLKTPSPKEKEKVSSDPGIDEELSRVARTYESEGFGPITSLVQEQIVFLKDEFGADWVLMAMREAVLHNKRRIKYVAAILQNWRADGGPRTSETKREAQSKGALRVGNSIGSSGSAAVGEKDPRYAAFYELFPD